MTTFVLSFWYLLGDLLPCYKETLLCWHDTFFWEEAKKSLGSYLFMPYFG